MANIYIGGIIAGILVFSLLSITVMAPLTWYGKSITYYFVRCSIFDTQGTCETANCYWWDDSCYGYPAIGGLENCYKLDEDIIYCTTTENECYILVNTGTYQAVVDC